jgi:putative membrane protein
MKTKAQWFRIGLAAVLACFALTACNGERGVEAAREDLAPVTPVERDFMVKASEAHLAELEMARTAMEKSANADVRDFANMIQKDHSKALENLAALMTHENVSQPTTLDATTQHDIVRMRTLKGAEFDREFINMMVAGHQKTLGMFRDQLTSAQNPDVRGHVEALAPTLEMHLDKALRLQSKLFSGRKMGS